MTDTKRSVGRRHGWAGVAFAVTFLAGLILVIDGPDATSPDADFVRFYGGSERNWVLIGMGLLTVAVVLFLVFAAGLVARIRVEDSPATAGDMTVMAAAAVAPTLALVAGALLAIVPAAMTFSHLPEPAPGLLRLSPQLGGPVLLVMLPAMLGLFVVASSVLGRRRGVLPAWVAVSGVVLGGLDMVAGFVFLPTVLAVLWLGVTGAVIALRPEPRAARAPLTIGAVHGAA